MPYILTFLKEKNTLWLPFSPPPCNPGYLTFCFNVIKLAWSCIIQYLFIYSTICPLYSGCPSPKTDYPYISYSLSLSPLLVALRLTLSIYLSLYLSSYSFCYPFSMTIFFLAFYLCVENPIASLLQLFQMYSTLTMVSFRKFASLDPFAHLLQKSTSAASSVSACPLFRGHVPAQFFENLGLWLGNMYIYFFNFIETVPVLHKTRLYVSFTIVPWSNPILSF